MSAEALSPLRVLFIEDDVDDVSLACRALTKAGYAVTRDCAQDAPTMRRLLGQSDWDVVLCDWVMPGFGGPDALAMLRDSGVDVPFLLMSGKIGEELAVDALNAGAIDFVRKDNMARLGGAVRRAITVMADHRARKQAEAERDAMLDELRQYAAQVEREVTSRTAALQTANTELQRLDAYKDDLLSIVSHDLRTPLNAIVGFASVLDEGVVGELSPPQHEQIQRILSSADRMLVLVDDLLDFAKIRAGKLTLDVSATPYVSLVEIVLGMLAPLAKRKDVTLVSEFDLGDDFAPPIDGRRVTQVLTNLLANALKFAPEGGTVTVAVSLDAGVVTTRISDTGPGISEEDQARIFVRFEQVNQGKNRTAGGTGLGLAIAKQLVEAHGGTIGVESTPGCGATFQFTLPGQTAIEAIRQDEA